jgi:ribonuclease D
MSIPDLPPPILVEDDQGMARLMEAMEDQPDIAVDTEADAFFSYRQAVCLIQITVGGNDYIVDPQADMDCGPLGRMFADPKRIKIFHDSEYDVLILRRAFHFDFAALFDTRVAAAVLGIQSPGLASVLESRFGVKLDKSMQRSDWSTRPLSAKQIAYARLDTHYLIPLAEELREELDTRDRRVIVESECRRLELLDIPDAPFDANDWVKIKGARDLSPRERSVLRELYILREEIAERQDVPPFRIINNPSMLMVAQIQPRDMKRLTGIKGFTPRMASKMGDKTLKAVERGLDADPIERLPTMPRKDGTEGLDEIQSDLYDRVKTWRKDVAAALGMESAYLLNRHVMTRLAGALPKDRDDLEQIDGIQDWQLGRHGDDLAVVLRKFHKDLADGKVPKRRTWKRR